MVIVQINCITSIHLKVLEHTCLFNLEHRGHHKNQQKLCDTKTPLNSCKEKSLNVKNY